VVATAASLDFGEPCPIARVRLVTAALTLAGEQLERNGMFTPFGLALVAHDEIVTLSALACSDTPCVEELIALLQAGLAAGRQTRRYGATALVFEVEIPLFRGGAQVRAIELRLCDRSSAGTLCFPHAREHGRVRLEWPHWRGEVASAVAPPVV
jgi:hypothetical protein